jgi:hypothetical protein
MCERAFSYLQPIVSKGRQVSVGRLDLPYVRPQRRSVALDGGKEQIYTIRFPSYDGMGSFCARITEEGLHGRWQVMDINSAVLESYFDDCCQTTFDLDYEPDAKSNIQETSTDSDHDVRCLCMLTELWKSS